MRPDNPNFRPCAMYTYKPWADRPGKHIGYEAVGAGWEPILHELDHQFVMVTGLGTDNHSKIRVLQIKEKFGGLRVYVDTHQLTGEQQVRVVEAIDRAEKKSFRTCEKCGARAVETRGKKGDKFSRSVTLCPEHHEERDNLPESQRLDLGNGHSVT